MNAGLIDEINTPKAFINKLGAFAVDVTTEDGMQSRYYPTKEDAIAALEAESAPCSLRDTTLEDVFIVRVGRGLGKDGGK